MISYSGLIKLGFSPEEFKLQDDSLGEGVYIKEWNSASPQPSEEEIETAHAEWQAEYDSQAYARTRAAVYPSLADFAEAYTEKEIGSSSTKWDAYVTAYNKARSDNPKP